MKESGSRNLGDKIGIGVRMNDFTIKLQNKKKIFCPYYNFIIFKRRKKKKKAIKVG